MQKYLFSKIMFLALATSALSTAQATKTKSLKEKLEASSSIIRNASHSFLAGAISGASFRATLYGIKTITQPLDASSQFVDVATSIPALIIALEASNVVSVTVKHLEEKTEMTPIPLDDSALGYTYSLLYGLGYISGGFAVNSLLYPAQKKSQ